MTARTFNPNAPEALPHSADRSWVSQMQTILSGLMLVGACVLLVGVILGVAPLFLGAHPFVVISGSMEPTIPTGSVVWTHAVPAQQVQVGDVIAFIPRPDAALPIIHRIVNISERQGTRYATTRGDANTGEDADIALTTAVLKVEGTLPLVGYAIYYAAQPVGTVLLIWIPIVLLVALWLKDRALAFWRARRVAL